jgi:hypothetical protein
MANNFKISLARRNANVDSVTAVLNGGTLQWYDGAQPATPDTAITTQTLLCTNALNATAAGASSGGTATFNAIASATIAASGTVAWFRLFTSGAVAVADGTVGTSGSDINVNSVAFSSGATLSVTSLTLSQP